MIKYMCMPKSMMEFVTESHRKSQKVTESHGDSHGDTILQQGWSCLWCGGM